MKRVDRLAMLRFWALVFLIFSLASTVQVLMYAPWGGQRLWRHLPDWLGTPLTLFFLFGPGTIAAVSAWRMLNRHFRASSQRPGVLARTLLVVLTILSCYVGVFISFNTWGT